MSGVLVYVERWPLRWADDRLTWTAWRQPMGRRNERVSCKHVHYSEAAAEKCAAKMRKDMGL